MMDLRLMRLSTNLYLETYLNENSEPVTLGLIIIPDPNDDRDYGEAED